MCAATKATAFVVGFFCLLLSHLTAQNITNLNETFTNTTFDAGSSAWTLGSATTVQQPNVNYYQPNLTATAPGNGALSLTSAANNEATYIYYNSAFNAQNASVYATFQYSSYGGSGADGISFFLFDASVMGTTGFVPGAFGGSLGYAQKSVAQGGDTTSPGLSGGYLGIGIDTFGNYSNPTEGRVGGPGSVPNSIDVRGPASSNYNYLTGTSTLSPGLDYGTNTSTPLSATVFNTVTIALTPTNQLSVYLQRAGSTTTNLLYTIDLSSYTRPDQLMFGFAAGTGGATDNHLIRDLVVSTATASLWKNTSGDSTWGNANNWNPNFVPSANANILLDNSTVTTAQTINLGAGQTRVVGTLSIDAPFSYTVDPTANNGTLEFQTTGASGIYLTSTHGAAATQTVNSSLKLDNAIEIKNNTTSALNVAGTVATNGYGLTLDGTGTGATTLSGIVSGSGSVIKNDSGTAVLSGANTYSGGTTLNAGTLTVGNNSALGTSGVVLNGGTLASNANNTISNSLALQGNAGLAVTGAGTTFTSSGTLTQTGGSYTLNLGSGVTQQGTVNLSDNNTGRALTVQVDSGTANISGAILDGGASAGSLIKTGAGTLQLNAASSYSGGTTISNGTLQLGASNVLLNTGNVSIDASGTLNLNTFSQKIGNLTALAGGATIDFGAQTGANTLVFNTYTAPASGVLVVNNWQQGTDTLATTVAGQTVSTIYLSGFGAATEAGSTSSTIYGSAYALTPVVQTGIYWKGNYDGNWTPGGANYNWVTTSGGSTTSAPPTNTQIAVFDSTGAARTAVTLNGANTIAGLKFDTSAPSYTISGANTLTLSGTVPYVQQLSSSNQTLSFSTLAMGNNTVFDLTSSGNLTVSSAITGAYNLIKDGTGTGKLILSGNNTYTGGAFINNGIVQIQSATALGTGAATIANGAALEVSNGTSITATNALSVTGTGVSGAGAIHNVGGANTLSGAVTLTGATTVATDTGTTLNLTGGITGANYGLTLNGAGTLTIGSGTTTGVVALGTGGVTINSTGTTTFAGTAANTYTGTTTVNSGTLVLGKSAGVTAVNGNLIIGDGVGAAGSTVVQVATGGGAQISANSAVTINSDGTLNLNGQSNTVAQLNATSSAAQVTLGAGTITVGGNANLNSSYAGTISGTGGLTKAGSGALALTNSGSSYSGPTAINAGIINVSTGGALGTSAVTVTSGASLQVTNLASNLANTVNLNGNGVGGAGAVESTAGTNTLTGNFTLQSNARIQADTGSTLNLTTGTLALGANTLDVSGGGNTTITRVISGTGGVTMDGTGTLALSGTNTFTGATAVNSGTLEIRNNAALGTTAGTTTVANGATLALNNATPIAEVTTTLNGAGVGNNGALRNIAGNNTWSGAVALASNSTIGADTGTTFTVSGVISGAGALTKAGAGTLIVSAANTYTGATNINGGTLQLGVANTLPSTTAVTIASGATLNLNGYAETVSSLAGASGSSLSLGAGTLTTGDTTSTTFAGVASGTGNITKVGTGTLTLSGANTYSGTTTVSAGILKLGANNALASNSALTLFGGTLATNGFSDVVNSLRLTASSTIDYGGLAGILTISTNAGGWTAGTLTISNWNGNLTGGGSDQFLVSSATGLSANMLSNITFAGYGAGAQIITVGSNFEVVPLTTATNTWNVDAAGNWTTTTNWTPNSNPSGVGISVNFAGAITANRTVTLDAARTVGYLNFNNSHNYTLAPAAAQRLTMDVGGGSAQINVTNTGSPTISAGLTLNDNLIINQDNASGTLTLSAANAITAGTAQGNITVNGAGNTVISGTITTGTGSLTKNEAGTLTLSSNANTYTGATTVNGGTLAATWLANGGVNSSIGASTNIASNLVINGGTLQYTGAATSSNRLFTIGTTAGSAIDASGTGTLSFTNTGSIVLNGTNTARTFTLTGSNTGANTFASILTDNGTGATSLTKSGAGTWVLSGANTYTGATTITAGTLRLGASNVLADTSNVNLTGATAIFDVNGQTDTVGSIAGIAGSSITLGAGALTSGGSNATTTFAGTITGTGTLTQSGTGTLTLTGANTYSGKTSIQNGVLSVSSLNKVTGGTASSNLGAPVTVANGTIDLGNGTNTGTLQYTGAGETTDRVINLAGSTGGGTIDSSGSGAVTFSSNLTATVAGAKTLTLTGTNAGNNMFSGNIVNGSGTTAVTKAGSGTWVLTGTNTYTGATAINSGILEIQSAAALGSTAGATTVASGATLNINNAAGLTVAENLTLNGFGTGVNGALHNIAGANTWSGTIALNSDSSIGVDSGSTLTVSGVISGAAANSLTKVGAGTLVLGNAANTYAGPTDVEGGTVSIAAEGDLGATPGTVTANQLTLNNGTLLNTGATSLSANRGVTLGSSGGTFNNSAALTVNSIITGTGSLTKTGASTLTLSAVNTYSGATNITGGTLQYGVANALPSATAVTISNAGTLALNNYSGTVGSIATGAGGGSITLGSGTLTTGGNNSSTTFAGGISGTGGLTKAGSGTLSITGASTYTGATAINAGTLQLGAGGSAMTGGSAVTIASGATFDVENGQTTNSIGALTANSGSTLAIGSGTLITTGGTISGGLSGSGTLQTSGTLTISSASGNVNFGSGTIVVNAGGVLNLASTDSGATFGNIILNGGTLNLGTGTGSGTYNITNLTVTGTSTIDFGTGAVTLNGGTFSNPSGTLSVTNWVNAVDYFYAQNWTGNTLNTRDQGTEPSVSFAASTPSYPASDTAWLPYDSSDSDPTKRQITPAPEPATYGAIFMSLSLLGLGLRRWRASRKS